MFWYCYGEVLGMWVMVINGLSVVMLLLLGLVGVLVGVVWVFWVVGVVVGVGLFLVWWLKLWVRFY